MPDLVVTSTRRGMNNTDAPLSLPADQCVEATNIEWTTSTGGERRNGGTAIDIAGSDLVGHATVPWLFRHFPSQESSDAELWALGYTADGDYDICRKTTAWSTVTFFSTIYPSVHAPYSFQGQSLHGKLFIAYESHSGYLMVWDGTQVRLCGMEPPAAAPTAADSGGAGTLSGTRYYRVREVVLSGTEVLRRSEPSATLTHTPDSAHATITVTRPADAGNVGTTHWELEASPDDADYYLLSRIAVASSTYDDSTPLATTYADGTLSEEIGDYARPVNPKYLLADEDRLVLFGVQPNAVTAGTEAAYASRMSWTPVYADTGVGNDERVPLDPVSFVNLDTYDGGPIMGAVGPVNGGLWVFKQGHIYKANRTGVRSRAYDIVPITKTRGAVEWSMIAAVDQHGSPCVYFLDHKGEPCRIGADDRIQSCGDDIKATWQTINLTATQCVARVVYYDAKAQVQWFVATGTSNVPDTRLVLHVKETRETPDGGVRGGWAVWTGASAAAASVCLYSDNIDADTDRNVSLVPFIGLTGSDDILRTDTGADDNGTAFAARVRTRPYAPAGLLHQFGVGSGAILSTATEGATVDVTVTRDFGAETIQVSGVDLSPRGSETLAVVPLDNLSMSEMRAVDVTVADPPGGSTARWELQQVALTITLGQGA